MSDPLRSAVVRFARLAARDPDFASLAAADGGGNSRWDHDDEDLAAFVDELIEEKGVELVLAAILEWMCDTYEEFCGNVQ